MPNTEIDTTNYQMVGGRGDEIIVLSPKQVMTKREAILHAAWLVVLADDNDEFDSVLRAVEHT